MKKPMIRFGVLGAVLGLLLMIPCGALAEPFTINSVIYGPTYYSPKYQQNLPNYANFTIYGVADDAYTEYYLETTIGSLDAFCVEDVDEGTGSFELKSVPPDLYDAAYVAEKYWNGLSTYTKEEFQIAVWELTFDSSFDLTAGNLIFNYDDHGPIALASNINAIAQYLLENDYQSYTAGNVSVAHETGPPNRQDFLVNKPVPEPASMLLMGAGLMAWGAIHRRRRN